MYITLQGEYPEMEILWLLTKAWNCGVHLYRYVIRNILVSIIQNISLSDFFLYKTTPTKIYYGKKTLNTKLGKPKRYHTILMIHKILKPARLNAHKFKTV